MAVTKPSGSLNRKMSFGATFIALAFRRISVIRFDAEREQPNDLLMHVF